MKKKISVVVITALLLTCMVTSTAAKNTIKSKSVAINASAVTLAVADIATLTAIMKPINSTDTLTWSSSNKSIATVNKYGVVTAVAEGSATISVKTSSKKTAKCEVTVKKELTKDEIEELVRTELLSEDSIKKLIVDNTISEEAVKKIVEENTLSEEDVKKIISEGTSWVDGTEVPIIASQKFPLLISDPSRTGIVGNIESLKITKRRMTSSIYQNNTSLYLPYRYDVILTANVPAITDAQKNTQFVEITLGGINAPNIIQAHDPYTISFSGTMLTEIVSVYSAYDVDEVYIESAVWKAK